MGTRPRYLATALAFAAILATPEASRAATPAGAAAATVSELKAAFLFNFAKFTEWPPDALRPGQAIALCVAGDNAIASALERIIKGRTIDGHDVETAVVSLQRSVASCHVLYVSGLDDKGFAELLVVLKGIPVLTVGDGNAFTRRGGIAELISEDGRMRFVINVTAARRARLTLSSQLLNLATLVKDGSDVDR